MARLRNEDAPPALKTLVNRIAEKVKVMRDG